MKLMKLSLVLLPAALLALSGCNSSSAVSPAAVIDTAPPAAPAGLGVALDGSGKRVLDWSANSEADLASYQVYQSTTSSSNGFVLVASVPAGSTDWTLPDVSGTVNAWFQVSAVDESGNHSAQSSSLNVTLLPAGMSGEEPVEIGNAKRH